MNKISGYYIDINDTCYGDWDERNKLNIVNLNKEIQLNENGNICNKECSKGDSRYTPIGKRIKSIGGSVINTIIFSNLNISKREDGEYGILTPSGSIISINESNESSKVFFKNFKDIKRELNDNNVMSIGSMFGSMFTSMAQLPGLDEGSTYKVLESDPEKFITSYCKDSNNDYKVLQQIIIKLHSIFNIISWEIDGPLNENPGIILLLARVYKELNQGSQLGNSSLEYHLTLPCDLTGLNDKFLSSWESKFHKVITSNSQLYQRPSAIGFLTMGFNFELFAASIEMIFDTIVDAPFNNCYHKGRDVPVLQSLFGLNEMSQIKSKSYLVPWINRYEPNGAPKELINEPFIKYLTHKIKSKGLMGIVLYKDRCENNDLINDQKILPSSINYDNSLIEMLKK